MRKLSWLLLGLAFLDPASAQTPALPEVVTYDQAIGEALTKNLDLLAERFNISVAEARMITARLRPNPVLTVLGQTLDLLGAGFNASSPVGPNQLTIHTDWVVERGKKRENRMAVATLERTLAEVAVREVMRRVFLDVTMAFVDVLQAKENLALAQQNLKSLMGIVEINGIKVRAGELARVELERSELAALQYETAVEQARLQLLQAKARLQLLIGRTVRSDQFEVTGELRHDPLLDAPVGILGKALTRRPDLRLLQQTQARSQADLKLQLAQGKVDLTLGHEYVYQRAYGIGGSTLGFSVAMPLQLFNRNQGEIARATREIQSAGAKIAALQANIGGEVESAYRQYDTSRRLLENIEKNMLGRARSVRDTMEYSYKRGEASLVEFLDAQRAYNDTVQSYNDARANYVRSLYLIDSVSGATVEGK